MCSWISHLFPVNLRYEWKFVQYRCCANHKTVGNLCKLTHLAQVSWDKQKGPETDKPRRHPEIEISDTQLKELGFAPA